MRISLLAFILTLPALPVLASSDDAWEQFRKDVAAGCLAAAAPMFETASARVDPFGSESYGLALVTGRERDIGEGIAVICVYDKKTKHVEIGGELPAE
jgi:hypothetical protein